MNSARNRMAESHVRKPKAEPQPARVVEVRVVATRAALVCPCCGRGADARVYKTDGLNRYMQCESCAGKYVAQYDADGKPLTVRPL